MKCRKCKKEIGMIVIDGTSPVIMSEYIRLNDFRQEEKLDYCIDCTKIEYYKEVKS